MFTCPLSQCLIKEPVATKYGGLFEKIEIERWVRKHHTCPTTKQPLEHTDLFHALAAKAAIQEFLKLDKNLVIAPANDLSQ